MGDSVSDSCINNSDIMVDIMRHFNVLASITSLVCVVVTLVTTISIVTSICVNFMSGYQVNDIAVITLTVYVLSILIYAELAAFALFERMMFVDGNIHNDVTDIGVYITIFIHSAFILFIIVSIALC